MDPIEVASYNLPPDLELSLGGVVGENKSNTPVYIAVPR